MRHLLWCLLVLSVVSCKTEEDNFSIDSGEDYFPLAIGQTWIYEMDSTIYDPNGASIINQSITQMRETIVDTLTDAAGNTLYKLEQFTRDSSDANWQIKNVYTTGIVNNQAQRTEENLKFIKLAFPLRENQSWDGNLFFDEFTIVKIAGESIEMFKNWNYRLREFAVADTIGGMNFDEVMVIEQANNENSIELRRAQEKYAKGIGLVYRELYILDTQCIADCEGQTWEEKAEKGMILKQTLIQ